MKFWQYSKFWIALGGAVVSISTAIWGDVVGSKAKQVVELVVPLITAMLVYLVPNTTA